MFGACPAPGTTSSDSIRVLVRPVTMRPTEDGHYTGRRGRRDGTTARAVGRRVTHGGAGAGALGGAGVAPEEWRPRGSGEPPGPTGSVGGVPARGQHRAAAGGGRCRVRQGTRRGQGRLGREQVPLEDRGEDLDASGDPRPPKCAV